MKKCLALLLAFTALLSAETALSEVDMNVNWYLGLHVGAKMPLSETISLKAGVGSSIFSLEGAFVLVYDLTGVFHLIKPADFISEPKDHWGLDMHLGLLDAFTVFTENTPTLLIGGIAGEPYFRINESWKTGIRLGVGIPVGINATAPGVVDVDDDLFPDMSLSVAYCF